MEFDFRETEGELELIAKPHQRPAPNICIAAMIQEQRSVRDLITTLQQHHAHNHSVKLLRLVRIHHFGEDFYRFFANNECPATLTTVILSGCHGAANLRLLEAFYTNKSVKVLKIIHGFGGLQGFALGNALSLLLVNNATVQRLEFQVCDLGGPEAVRALQPGLRANRNLKELVLSGVTNIRHTRGFYIGNEGIRILAETLQGNTQIELLDVSGNSLSAEALDDITTILESCTGLHKLYFGRNHGVLNNPTAARRFASVLSRSPSLETLDIFLYYCNDMEFDNRQANSLALIIAALEEPSKLQDVRLSGLRKECINQLIISLPRMKCLKRFIADGFVDVMHHVGFIPALLQNTSLQVLPGVSDGAVRQFKLGGIVVATNTILARNCGLANADALLQLQPGDAPHDHNSGVWSEAIAKLGEDRVNASAHPGASAVFKILREKPELQKQE